MGLGVLLAAFLWGFAEASFFFIAPDLLLSFLAIGKARPGVAAKAAVSALAGALLGGAVTYCWAVASPGAAAAFIESLPAISAETLRQVTDDLADTGLASLFLGALTGVPYKVFALQAAGLSLPLSDFLLVSIPARLFRWCLVICLARWICGALARRWSIRRARAALGGFWLLFYAAFFALVPG